MHDHNKHSPLQICRISHNIAPCECNRTLSDAAPKRTCAKRVGGHSIGKNGYRRAARSGSPKQAPRDVTLPFGSILYVVAGRSPRSSSLPVLSVDQVTSTCSRPMLGSSVPQARTQQATGSWSCRAVASSGLSRARRRAVVLTGTAQISSLPIIDLCSLSALGAGGPHCGPASDA
jgi:hypothetical protein